MATTMHRKSTLSQSCSPSHAEFKKAAIPARVAMPGQLQARCCIGIWGLVLATSVNICDLLKQTHKLGPTDLSPQNARTEVAGIFSFLPPHKNFLGVV